MMLLCWLIAVWIVFGGVKAFPSKLCTDDQYKRILPNGSAVCIDCLMCPEGLGPSVECGSTISADTKIECKICKAGVSFSPSNSNEQCESCSVCSEDQVSKPCTPSSDTVCEKRCQSKEKYYEKSSDDCQDCTWCCGDDNDIVKNECLMKGMPAEKSCTVHRKKFCKPPPTTERPPTTIHSNININVITTPTKTIEEELINATQRSARKISNNKTSQQYRSHSSSVKSAPTTEWQVLIGVCVSLGVFSAASLVCLLIIYREKCWKYCAGSQRSRDDLEVIYIVKEDEDSIIATYKESKLFELFENYHQLKDAVCNKLDLKKSFARLARHKCCKMNEDKVRKLEEPGIQEPTRQVFDWIEGAKPAFLFGEFVEILKHIERNDVLKYCVETLQPSKEIHSQVVLNK